MLLLDDENKIPQENYTRKKKQQQSQRKLRVILLSVTNPYRLNENIWSKEKMAFVKAK